MTRQNVWNISLLLTFFQGFKPYLEARISGSGSASGCKVGSEYKSVSNKNQSPDPHQGISRIRIRIKVMRIHNTAFSTSMEDGGVLYPCIWRTGQWTSVKNTCEQQLTQPQLYKLMVSTVNFFMCGKKKSEPPSHHGYAIIIRLCVYFTF